MRVVENVYVIGAAPNQNYGRDADLTVLIFNECLSRRNFQRSARLNRPWGKKEGRRCVPVGIPKALRKALPKNLAVTLNGELPSGSIAAVSPSWLRREPRDPKIGMPPVPFWNPGKVLGWVVCCGRQFDVEAVNKDESSLGSRQRLFGMSERGSHVSGLSYTASPSDPPQADSRDCQNASECDQPRRKICSGFASCLFPKPVIFLFLAGALGGGCIVAWAVIQGQRDENPRRERDQRGDSKPPFGKPSHPRHPKS